jgi:chromosome partitioning protein
MKIWTIAAQKGGVGKTTTTMNLAGTLLREGARVLLVDLDPHGSLTSYCGLDPDTVEPNVYEVFAAAARDETLNLADIVHRTRLADLALAPASGALVTLERRFGLRSGMGLALSRSLQTVADQYDYCLVDCPPTLGVLVINALVCCELLIAPVQTEFLAEQSLDRLLHTLQMIERSRGTPLPYLVVPTMYDRRTRAATETLAAIRARRDLVLWDEFIPVDTQFREASRLGEPLTLRQPYARGSVAYQHLLAALRGDDAVTALRAVG